MPSTTFNLKQRLAALSLAQSSPSSPQAPNSNPNYLHTRNGDDEPLSPRSSISPNSKRKIFNTPSWMKKPQQVFVNSNFNSGYRDAKSGSNGDGGTMGYQSLAYVGEEEKRMVQEVLPKMIFQAGVDFETRPMVVLNASALPDPQVVSYDLLLIRILSYLDLYVEADYTVVFFAAGSKNTPSWNWVWKAYRSLKRKYRKNLKQLYIVHSSFFSKMLFSLAGAIISPKFFRKIVYITTLSELAQYVPLTQIDIPPAVYQENLKFERKISMPVPTRSDLFGVPLEDLMGYDGEKDGIPRVVKDAIQFLRESGMREEGLFRRSPSSSLLRAAQEAYDRGNVVSLNTFGDPHLAAVLLKKYLRDLPEPLFPESMYPTIRRCPIPASATRDADEEEAVRYIRDIIFPEMVPCAFILLSQVLHLLHEVSLRCASNRMDATNLAIVICPNLVKGSNPMRDVMMCGVGLTANSIGVHGGSSTDALSNSQIADNGSPNPQGAGFESATLGMVIALCIRRYYEIFDEVVDRSEAVKPWRALGHGGLDGEEGEEGMYVLGDDEEDDDWSKEAGPSNYNSGVNGHPRRDSQQYANGANVKRHRNTLSNASNGIAATRSVFGDATTTPAASRSSTSASPAPAWSGTPISSRTGTVRNSTHGKAKSLVSIGPSSSGLFRESAFNNALGTGTMGGRKAGSISIGRGSMKNGKGSGAAVEAIGVVAEGFFTPPSGMPPVPPLPKRHADPGPNPKDSALSSPANEQEEVDEERVLSVSERRRLFEAAQVS